MFAVKTLHVSCGSVALTHREKWYEKRIWWFICQNAAVLVSSERTGSWEGEERIFTVGTKDERSPSAGAMADCQPRERPRRQSRSNKPVNVALFSHLACRHIAYCLAWHLFIPDDGRLILKLFKLFFFPASLPPLHPSRLRLVRTTPDLKCHTGVSRAGVGWGRYMGCRDVCSGARLQQSGEGTRSITWGAALEKL